MNHYLIFSAINDYFKDISTLDAGRIIAAFIYMDHFIAKLIAEEVILHTIPEYYDKYRGNPDPFDLQQVLDEAAKRGYSTTQGSTIYKEKISVSITIKGRTFELVTLGSGGWVFRFAKEKNLEIPIIDANGVLNMLEDINDANTYTLPLISQYLFSLGTMFDLGQYKDAEYFSCLPSTTSSEGKFSYWGLPTLAVYFHDQGLEPEDILTEVRIDNSSTEVKSNPYLKDPETFLKRCTPIQEACKKNSLVENIAEKSIIEVLKKYSPNGIVDMSEVKYACYDSGVILLAPYERKGAIIGFLDYTKMAALEDTISRIISYTDGTPLPEGFVLMKD